MAGQEVKAEKATALHARFADVSGAILADYRGLNVQQMAELRNQLRKVNAEFQVVKNTLARRAAEDTDFAQLVDYFVGPTSVALTVSDVVAMSKTLTEYAKSEPKLEIRAGLLEGKVVLPQEIAALADLPPRDILLGRMLAGMQSPLTGLVGVLQGVLRQLLYALLALKEVKEG